MFPGQPLARDLFLPEDADFVEIATLARYRAGFDLLNWRYCTEHSTEQTALQIYGAAMSLYRNRLLRRQGKVPAIVAEHSMGIYSALAAVDCLSEGDALELTARFGYVLAKMREVELYALGCIIGLPQPLVLTVAENNGVFIANHNTSRHFLVAGQRFGVESAIAEALSLGAFSARQFPCDAPLHTPLIQEVTHELRDIIAEYRFQEPDIPLLNHINQDYLSASSIPEFLIEELCLPVYWEETYLALLRRGVSCFIEVGVGDSLKKYNRWISSEHQF